MTSRYGLAIRGASATDAAGIAALVESAGCRCEAASLARRLEAVAAEGQGAVLLAVEWGPPSGLIALGWRQSLADDRPIAAIDMLVVDPTARRRGIARALLKAASHAARSAGCGSLRFDLPAEKTSLLSLFATATGFETRGAVAERALRKRGGAEHD